VNDSPPPARPGRGLDQQTLTSNTAEQLIAQCNTVADFYRMIEVTQPTDPPLAAAIRGDAGRGGQAANPAEEGKRPAQKTSLSDDNLVERLST